MYGSRGDVVFSWGEDKAAAANKTPIKQNADQSRQAGRQERKKDRKKEIENQSLVQRDVTGPQGG